MNKMLRATMVMLSLLATGASINEARADARLGGHFVGGVGPHHKGGREVGGRTVRHPIRALLRRL